MKKLLLSIAAVLAFAYTSEAQLTTQASFGSGIQITGTDANKNQTFATKINMRIQPRYDGMYVDADGSDYMDRWYVRRGRIKAAGWAFSKNIEFKMQYDMVGGNVLDALVKFKVADNTKIWFGQGKLNGNRESNISSQKLQFVDRSMLSSKFTLDRDAGVGLEHKIKAGENFVIKEKVSIAQGDGINNKSFSNGHAYTGRIEILPLGEFTKKGDYSGGDLKREKKPKLAIGVSYDMNTKSVKERGQKGDAVADSLVSDLSTLFADFMFKVNGFSLMGEFATREVADDFAQGTYYTGSAINVQAGYLFKNNFEVAGRVSMLSPDKEVGDDISEVTIGLSRYIVGHNLKIQSDFGIIQEDNSDDEFMFRLQMEVAF
ncbi:MAG: FmdC precursor [Bacteroidia bacterium]|nr:FmdC precursor [Bacteroidia bacterium]NNC84626.1 FmdC precursor [Bacteroidia bacterium]